MEEERIKAEKILGRFSFLPPMLVSFWLSDFCSTVEPNSRQPTHILEHSGGGLARSLGRSGGAAV